jgi:nitrile hydratase subunit beta
MKLQHTLGGLEGLDPVEPEFRVFVEPWETRIFGIHTAMMALSPQLSLPQTSSTFRTIWTWADLRKGAEAMNPFDYLKYRYYEKWLGGIAGHFISNGYITAEEMDERTRTYLGDPERPLPTAEAPEVDARVHTYLMDGDSPQQKRDAPPLFKQGDRVLVGNPPTVEHTRLPGFLRNRTGIVETVYDGSYSYLCSTGSDGVGPAMPVYCVKFDPQDLWPGNTEPGFSFYADLYQAYVGPVPAVTTASNGRTL